MRRPYTATAIAALAVGMGLLAAAGISAHAADTAPLRLATAESTTGKTATPLATVGVRAGEHTAFSRLVADWTVPVDYRVDQTGGRVRVIFDRPAEIAIGRVAAGPPSGVASVAVSRDGRGHPTLSFVADGRIRHFRDGTKIVIDVMRATDKKVTKAAAPVPAVPVPAVPIPAVPIPAVPEPAAATSPAKAERETVGAPGPVALKPSTSRLPADAQPSLQQTPSAGHAPTSPVAVAAVPHASPRAGSVPKTPIAETGATEPTRVTGAPIEVEVETARDGLRMSFVFDEPTGAATFRRGGYLWLIFDTVARVDIDALTEQAGSIAPEIEQIGHRDATVLRMQTEPGYNPSIASDGNRWNFFLAPQTLKPDTPLDVVLPQSRAASLSIVSVTAGSTLALRDPEIGDVFFVVPVIESAHGVEQVHDFIDFRLLPSVQGVAVSPYSDRVDVRARADGVSVAAIGGLRMTLPSDRARLLKIAEAAGPPDAFFNFRGWQRNDEGSYDLVHRALVERLLAATQKDRNLARLDLARFYFAYGLADRASGILAQIVREEPGIERSPAFRALRGAVALLMGNAEMAKEDLGDRGLDPEAEIEVWRAAVLAEQEDMVGAAFGFHQAERFVSAYPDSLRARFGLTGARAALAIDDISMAEFWLQFLKLTPLTGSQTERRKLIEAEIAAANGEAETALALFDQLLDGNDRYSRARAGLARIELLVRDERITPAEGAAQLDRLRYVWRGDVLEFDILRRLGELQIEAQEYRDGLLTLKRAVSNFVDEPFTPEVTEEMRATFRRLYLDGEADGLPAVTAIALFNEFHELAPAGDEGDEMIRRLAGRMIAVDLLDKAAELLAHQVEFRLKGEQKARIGSQLAIVRLLDRKPEEALAALDASRVSGVSVDLARERQMVGARAWAESGNKARALSLIAEDRSREADRLRAEILWRARDWAGAAAVLARLAGKPPKAGTPLTEQRARYVLNGAVALALANDQTRLSRLRLDYGKAMEGTPLAADFRIVAAADRTARDFDDVLQRIATVDDFDAFMKSYRDRLTQPQKMTATGNTNSSG